MQDLTAVFNDLIDNIIAEDLELVASIAVIIVALVLVWLLLRGPRLWYWKVSQKAGVLNRIDSRLKHVEKILVQEVSTEDKTQQLPADKAVAEQEPITENTEKTAPKMAEELEQQTDGRLKEDKKELYKVETYLGKSGKLYREDELSEQIKD